MLCLLSRTVTIVTGWPRAFVVGDENWFCWIESLHMARAWTHLEMQAMEMNQPGKGNFFLTLCPLYFPFNCPISLAKTSLLSMKDTAQLAADLGENGEMEIIPSDMKMWRVLFWFWECLVAFSETGSFQNLTLAFSVAGMYWGCFMLSHKHYFALFCILLEPVCVDASGSSSNSLPADFSSLATSLFLSTSFTPRNGWCSHLSRISWGMGFLVTERSRTVVRDLIYWLRMIVQLL